MHKKKHMSVLMDPKFYENDFMATNDTELEFVRSPFYDLARRETMSKDKAQELL